MAPRPGAPNPNNWVALGGANRPLLGRRQQQSKPKPKPKNRKKR